jgi:hypothetical protein
MKTHNVSKALWVFTFTQFHRPILHI